MWLFRKSKPEIQSIVDAETEEQEDDLAPPLPPDDYYKKSRVFKSNKDGKGIWEEDIGEELEATKPHNLRTLKKQSNKAKGKILKKSKQSSRPDKVKSETGVDKEKITYAEKLNQEILRIKNELGKLEQGRIN